MASGGGDQQSRVYQSSLPEYAKPYYTSLMERGANESYRPYQPYLGQRIAGMSPETAGGLSMASDYANSGTGYLPYAQAGAAQSVGQGLGYGNYDPTAFYAGAVQEGGGPLGYSNVNEGPQFNSGIAQLYMSPYMADVTALAKQDQAYNTLVEQTYRDSEAAKAGAFGGSRAAVQNQIALNDAQKRMMQLDVEGRQSAFENAQQQFERDRAAYMNAQKANQDAALKAALSNQTQGLEAQKLGEQSRQFGVTSGLQGLEAAQRGTTILGQLQQQQDQMALDRIKAQLGVGQTTEDYTQQQLDQAYNDFVNQRDANRQNLQFLSSLLQGVPVSANQDVTTTTSTNPLAGAAGTLMGLQALYNLG